MVGDRVRIASIYSKHTVISNIPGCRKILIATGNSHIGIEDRNGARSGQSVIEYVLRLCAEPTQTKRRLVCFADRNRNGAKRIFVTKRERTSAG